MVTTFSLYHHTIRDEQQIELEVITGEQRATAPWWGGCVEQQPILPSRIATRLYPAPRPCLEKSGLIRKSDHSMLPRTFHDLTQDGRVRAIHAVNAIPSACTMQNATCASSAMPYVSPIHRDIGGSHSTRVLIPI